MDDTPSMCGNLPFGGPPDTAAVPTPASLDRPLVEKGRPAERAAIADVKWGNGRDKATITVAFRDVADAWTDRVRGTVRDVAPEWERYANVKFDFAGGGGDVLVALTPGGAGADYKTYSSYLGTQSLAYSRVGQPSMRLVFPPGTDDTELRRVILHEFGHALGLIHEQHRPDRPFEWNEPAVIREYTRITQGRWTPQMIHEQVMDPYTGPAPLIGMSIFDTLSIMIYPIPQGLARFKDGSGDFVVGWNNDLSATDKTFIAQMYPGVAAPPVGPPPPGPGPSPPTPGPPARRDVTLGTPVDDAIDPAGQRRRYFFTLPDAGMVAFRTEGTTPIQGELFGPDSETVRAAGLPQADNVNIDAKRWLDAGRWCLELRFDDPAAAGRFRLTVSAA